MFTAGRLPFIDSLLSDPPPRHLFHYTNPRGLEGICRSKQLWAGRAADLNNTSEQVLADQSFPTRDQEFVDFQATTTRISPAVEAYRRRSAHDTNGHLFVAASPCFIGTSSRDGAPTAHGVEVLLWACQQIICESRRMIRVAFQHDALYDHQEQQRLINKLLTHNMAVFVKEQVRFVIRSTDTSSRRLSRSTGFTADLAQFETS